MNRDFQSELDKIDETIDQLMSIASSDGKITKEEQAILDEIMNEMSDYRLMVLDALEDGEIDENEEQEMRDALDKIVDNASKMAIADGTLSDDEKRLIDSLIDFANH